MISFLLGLFLCPKNELFSPKSDLVHRFGLFMKKIKYEINGKIVELEVEDSFAAQYEIITQESKRNDWKHDWRNRKNNASLEVLEENGFQFISKEKSAQERIEETEEIVALRKALSLLKEFDRVLIERIYFNGEKAVDIAKELGVGKSAISNRLERIFKKIKKFL